MVRTAAGAGERIPKIAAMRAEVLAAAGRLDDAAAALNELRRDRFAAITPDERPHSIATLAGVAVDVATSLRASSWPR